MFINERTYKIVSWRKVYFTNASDKPFLICEKWKFLNITILIIFYANSTPVILFKLYKIARKV